MQKIAQNGVFSHMKWVDENEKTTKISQKKKQKVYLVDSVIIYSLLIFFL